VTFARWVTGEAIAYAKCGLNATRRAPIARHHADRVRVGVLLVHGVGADRTQFSALADALAPTGAWIDGFDYPTARPFSTTLAELSRAITQARQKADRLVLVGHSLGGVLLSMLVQGDDPPPHAAGLVTVCAPLHGTTRGRLAPWPDVRGITPDGPHIRRLIETRHRLATWGQPILTIGADRDAFVAPVESAFLEGHPTLRLEGSGHVASLFDPRTHAAISALVRSRF